jgi:hypothetical protein
VRLHTGIACGRPFDLAGLDSARLRTNLAHRLLPPGLAKEIQMLRIVGLCVASAFFVPPALAADAAVRTAEPSVVLGADASPDAVVQSQGTPRHRYGRPGSPRPVVGGGTPEPGTMLLLAGAALGYAGLRRRARK